MVALNLHKYLFEKITEGIGLSPDQDQVPAYEWAVYQVLGRIDGTLGELDLVTSEFSEAESLAVAIMRLKYYHVLWISITDQLALLTSEAFELGIDPRDVKMFAVLRNKNVDPELKKILERHQGILRDTEFRKVRNSFIHQGVFNEVELEAAWEKDAQQELRDSGSDKQMNFCTALSKLGDELHLHHSETRLFVDEYTARIAARVRLGANRPTTMTI